MRTLHLLALLQNGGDWPTAALARRLEVSERTVRRDAQRLRDLGYDVRARPGPGAGYRFHPGVKIPPLLFSEDEISAMVTGLSILGAWTQDEPTVNATLAKLDQVLPHKLRRRAAATASATRVLQRPTAVIDGVMIGVIADAVAADARIQFGYTDQRGRQSTRTVEPFRHVLRQGRWYLVGFDLNRDDWRLFCLDRIQELQTLPGTFRPHDFPDHSLERWLTTDFGRVEQS